MLLFRSFLFFCLLVLPTSCGFRPLYLGSENLDISRSLSKISILSIEDRVGQIVHNLLLDRLNPNAKSKDRLYTLDVGVSVVKQDIGLKFTNEATRATLALTAEYSLINDEDGQVLNSGEVRSVNSYNISDSEFSRIVSERDAMERAAREVSDEIKTRLSLHFSQKGR
tara:strand:- start:23 stop:526 length:504 start_codon:yes stop_codon:yes gene_type:complete